MKKLNIKFLLTLYIILLSGIGQLYAGGSKNFTDLSSVKADVNSAYSELNDESDCLDAFQYPSKVFPVLEKQYLKVYISDNEVNEENPTSFSGKTGLAGYSSVGYAMPAPYCRYTKKCLTFNRHSFYLPTYRRYLMFRVFRI